MSLFDVKWCSEGCEYVYDWVFVFNYILSMEKDGFCFCVVVGIWFLINDVLFLCDMCVVI